MRLERIVPVLILLGFAGAGAGNENTYNKAMVEAIEAERVASSVEEIMAAAKQFQAIADEFSKAGASRQIADAETLASTVDTLLRNPVEATQMADAAAATAAARENVLDRVVGALAPLLDDIAPTGS